MMDKNNSILRACITSPQQKCFFHQIPRQETPPASCCLYEIWKLEHQANHLVILLKKTPLVTEMELGYLSSRERRGRD